MWNHPSDQELNNLARLNETEGVPWQDKVIHQHYFLGGYDWNMAVYDSNRRGYFAHAILNNDLENAERGYISLDELMGVRVGQGSAVDQNLHWKSRTAGRVDGLVATHIST